MIYSYFCCLLSTATCAIHWNRTRGYGAFFFSSRRRHTRSLCDWSSDVCSSDLHAANPALYANLPYDSEKDFAPISMVTKVSEILLVPNSSPAKSVKEFVEFARQGQLNYASVGVGSLAHLASELFLSLAGVRMTHIPYRSVPQAQQAVMTGEVAAFLDTPIIAPSHIPGCTL